MKKIVIYGAGYVGLANGLSLARKNDVTVLDINNEIIEGLKNKKVHIDDNCSAQEILKSSAKFELKNDFNLTDEDIVILALPTNYDEDTKKFDTSFLDNAFKELNAQKYKGTILIKSTIPLGYTQSQKEKYPDLMIIFTPEFLREGTSFTDAIEPSRIIVGNKRAEEIGRMFLEVAENIPKIILTTSTEAEAIKLFANTYLAMRVSFVNELDTFAKLNNLDAKSIIKGVGTDPRIGEHYFTPSFGYGGYCLPKDSKQLRYEFNKKRVPSILFDAIVESNEIRKQFIVDEIVRKCDGKFTIEGIGHKPGVSNFRNSPKLEVAKILRDKGVEVEIKDKHFKGQTIEGFLIK